jgi:hypothetical protein
MRILLALVLCCFGLTVQAENAPEYTKPKLPLFSFVTEIPATTINSVEYSFTKESIPAWAVIIGTTSVLYHYDDDIYSGTKANGLRWGIGNEDHTKTAVKAFGFDLLRLPSDTGSAMYFLGDGWIHTLAALSFVADGWATGDVRPWNTGMEMVHGMIVSTIFSQAIKRATGRQSPNRSTEPKGQWRPFPSIAAYQKDTASYDAFPSGHIMTATLAFTVIQDNYPEYSAYVTPLEILWLGALGFEMVNNGVHWASDYPLGIGIGYAVGKVAHHMDEKAGPDGKKQASNWTFFPTTGEDGPMLNALYKF